MNTITLSMKSQNKTIPLQIEQMTVYAQSKILKAHDTQDNTYYLVFYKDRFLNVWKANELDADSHIAKAFEHGILLSSPHPLILALVSSEKHLKRQSFNQLFKSLEKSFSLQEIALIATYFDAFIEKEKLFTYIRSLYYQLRRDGKMFAGYRIVQILADWMPENEWAKSLSNELNANKYRELYASLDKSLLKQDPIFYEKALFSIRNETESFSTLFTVLENQGRWLDQTVLLIARFSSHPAEESYTSLKQIGEAHFNPAEVLDLLESLYTINSSYQPLQNDLLNFYLKTGHLKKMIQLVTEHSINLSDEQEKQMMHLLENYNPQINSNHLPNLNKFLVPLFKTHVGRAQQILNQSLEVLLQSKDIDEVIDWLIPLDDIPQAKDTINKVQLIKYLINDLDNQHKLGELYYNFRYLEGALECFSWEMELKKNDPSPVQWLARIYNEKGMPQEAKAYHQLYASLAANAT
ncbi:hypothetical protein [Halobacillus naozhouensis]|uniref:Uncharacterized protein n=1 Tax=Halobacillus naozhouensis TaxID=554880 RepID=A0ABY8J323_9BACI|nr:hypothetical protein [Halobacillus naozhouensis]WFT76486.1 hypothetical protein P9989_09035 [Halobacillus naozhouensis]